MLAVPSELKVRAVFLLLGLAMQIASRVAMAVVFSELWEARTVARDQCVAMLRALTQAPARLPAWLFDAFVPDEASVRGRLIWNSLFFAAIGIGLQWLACRRGVFYMQAGVPVPGAVLNTGLCAITVREAILPAEPWLVRYDGGFRLVRHAIRKSGARRVTAVLLVRQEVQAGGLPHEALVTNDLSSNELASPVLEPAAAPAGRLSGPGCCLHELPVYEDGGTVIS